MASLLVRSQRVVFADGVRPAEIRVENGKIVSITNLGTSGTSGTSGTPGTPGTSVTPGTIGERERISRIGILRSLS